MERVAAAMNQAVDAKQQEPRAAYAKAIAEAIAAMRNR